MGNAAQHLLRKHPVLAVHLASAVPQREIVAILLSSAPSQMRVSLCLESVHLSVRMASVAQHQPRMHLVSAVRSATAAQ
ncbi:MAG: hypothetical protein CL912_28320 [Deltaproteobacteria bacterium]|nr:hypothetical protein [Deltaproteobacteria bacterium]